MQKFLNHHKFLATLNQWVLDGSRIVTFDSNPLGEVVTLKGRDGAGEILAFFYDEEDYDQSELESTEVHLAPIVEESKDDVSPAQKLVNDTLDQVRHARVDLVEKLMVNPGFLSTFGKDFIVEFEDIETWINDNRDYQFNSLNEIRLEVKHKIRIRERDHSEQNPDVDKELKEHSLRQNLEGNIESV